MADMQEVVKVWEEYLRTVPDWQQLVAGIQPKPTGCGPIYELTNPVDRPNESFAIADMRKLELSQPHKHINGEVEIYFVIQGAGKMTVGDKLVDLKPGTSIVTPSDTIHITKPRKDLVVAVVNTPPFNPNNNVDIDLNDPEIAENIRKLQS